MSKIQAKDIKFFFDMLSNSSEKELETIMGTQGLGDIQSKIKDSSEMLKQMSEEDKNKFFDFLAEQVNSGQLLNEDHHHGHEHHNCSCGGECEDNHDECDCGDDCTCDEEGGCGCGHDHGEEFDSEYEAERELCINEVLMVYEDFEKSEIFKKLEKEEREEARSVVSFLGECMFDYFDVDMEQWESGTLKKCIVETLPETIAAEDGFFETVVPVLDAFFKFLEEAKYDECENFPGFWKEVSKLNDIVISNSKDKSKWDETKLFLMTALEEGVDLDNGEELEAFLAKYNQSR